MSTTSLPETVGLNWGPLNLALKHLTLGFLAISLTLMVRLLLYARLRPSALRYSELSASIHVYLWFHVCGAILSIPYNTYVIVGYYRGKNVERTVTHYNMLYWLGQWQNSYNAMSPLVVLFLTLDRCVALKFAANPQKRIALETWLWRVSVVTLLCALGASTGVYLAELPLNYQELVKLGCESVSCIMVRLNNLPQLFFKCAVGFANICSCAYFLHILRKISAAKHMKNRFIIVTLCFELCLNILPAFVSVGFDFFGSGPVSNVVSSCSALDAACCAVYYSVVFLPNKLHGVNSTTYATVRAPPKTTVAATPITARAVMPNNELQNAVPTAVQKDAPIDQGVPRRVRSASATNLYCTINGCQSMQKRNSAVAETQTRKNSGVLTPLKF